MWYLAEILFAQEPVLESKKSMFMCETSNVLFNSDSAITAYERAIEWAKEHVEESLFSIDILGVTRLVQVDKDRPDDGTEIFGTMFKMKDVWNRKESIIPDKNQLTAIKWETNSNVPVEDLIEEKRGRRFLDPIKE